MTDWELPADLQRLQTELSSLPQPSAPSGLQATVFRNVRTELRGRERQRTQFALKPLQLVGQFPVVHELLPSMYLRSFSRARR